MDKHLLKFNNKGTKTSSKNISVVSIIVSFVFETNFEGI